MTSRLPELEAMAIFSRVVQQRSFTGAATELGLSKATVSKAVSRLEAKLSTQLINRTSRRLALTDAGRLLASRTANLLAEAEAAEEEVLSQSLAPQGEVRVTAPLSYGLQRICPLLPEFFSLYPEVVVDLDLSDRMVDLIDDGFDAAIRIASLPDSSLVARTLVPMARYLVGAPAYFAKHGRPDSPNEIEGHRCLGGATGGQNAWHFSRPGHGSIIVRPSGPFRTNIADAILPALYAGVGLALLPEFMVADALSDGRLERLLPDWESPGGAVHWLTPPGRKRPKRVEVLGAFLARKLSARPAT